VAEPLLWTITDTAGRHIRRSLAFDVALLEPSFVAHYSRIKARSPARRDHNGGKLDIPGWKNWAFRKWK
jgi:hypothetical protein